MRKPRIIIVGGGPSGGACALTLARTGKFEVLVLDKSVYPRVKVCGSGLSPHAFKMLDRLAVRERFAASHGVINTVAIRGPAGGELRLNAGIEAWVVPRAELDHGIIQAAVQHGAEFREGTKVLALERGADRVGVKTEGGDLEADFVVCADGSPSRFSSDERPKSTIRTIVGWWRGTPWNGHEAHMIWDRRLAGYYAWMFPEPGGVVNIGLTIPEAAPAAGELKPLFHALLDEYWAAGLRNAEQVGKWMGHPAVTTTSIGPIAERRTLWVGEAARLVSPGTVEGISFALESGITAGECITRHVTAQTGLSSLACAGYRAQTAANVLAKFWLGEGLARGARSPRARGWGERLLRSRAGGWFNRAISAALDDTQHAT